jgi:cytoskeletal protein RodZ
MKDQFEKDIKSLVEDFSYDYDPKAWEALSKQLPQAKNGFSWLGKLAVITVLSAASVALYFNFSSTETKNVNTNNEKTIQKQAQIKQISNQNQVQNNKQASNKSNTTTQSSAYSQYPSQVALTPLISGSNTTNQTGLPTTPNNPVGLIDADQVAQQRIAPLLQTTIANPSNLQTNPPMVEENQVQPCLHKIALSADPISYETGVPVVHITAESSAQQIDWTSSNGQLIQQKSKSIELYAWNKQTYKVSAKFSQEDCNLSESIQIQQDQTYNLLAVNAFNPQSRDERNARFMPYALTIRDVQFQLIIIDPDNGSVLYKTSDAQNAWDGIDQRNGQLIPAQKAYIWKVVLENPLPGEKNTYTGTIVRI